MVQEQDAATVAIGKIVRSESHVRYTCQVYAAGEVAHAPEPTAYAFGNFVRIPLAGTVVRTSGAPAVITGPQNGGAVAPGEWERPARASRMRARSWAVGIIFDTLLVNPAFGGFGPRLSNDEQVALFSPDYLSERAVLVSLLLLGTMTHTHVGDEQRSVLHGVPALAPDLGAEVETLSDAELRAFHYFADGGAPGGNQPYLHMGYLPHAVATESPLLPHAMLRTIERLEQMFPANAALLSIVKRNFAWRLKVQTAG